MSRIKVIQPEEADSPLKEIYSELVARRGRLSEVMKIQSLHPESIRSHVAFYMDIMFDKTALMRAEKELIAVVVSVVNGCRYCQVHHCAALNAYWKDEERIAALKRDYRGAELSQKELAMCVFAVSLTKEPSAHETKDYTVSLREAGLTDEAILDVVAVTSYFNFVNRLVLSLGVELEEHNGEGYNY